VTRWVSFVRGTPINYNDPSGHYACGDGIDDERCEQSYPSTYPASYPFSFFNSTPLDMGDIIQKPSVNDQSYAETGEESYDQFSTSGGEYESEKELSSTKSYAPGYVNGLDLLNNGLIWLRDNTPIAGGRVGNAKVYVKATKYGLQVTGASISNTSQMNMKIKDISAQATTSRGDIFLNTVIYRGADCINSSSCIATPGTTLPTPIKNGPIIARTQSFTITITVEIKGPNGSYSYVTKSWVYQ
jgi:hypothetical protein